MTAHQFNIAKEDLLQKMTDVLDRTNPLIVNNVVKHTSSQAKTNDEDNISSSSSSEEEVSGIPQVNVNYNKAVQELSTFMTWKSKKYRPTIDTQSTKTTRLGTDETLKSIYIGPVKKRKEDLPNTARDGRKKNLTDYIDERGQMDLVKFFTDFYHVFPTLWIIILCLASMRVVEVGCECFSASLNIFNLLYELD